MRIPFEATLSCLAIVACWFASHPVKADTDPVQVFILAGQSNMVGYGRIDNSLGTQPNGPEGTLALMVSENPGVYGHDGTSPLIDRNGDWLVRDDVSVYSRIEGNPDDLVNSPGIVQTGGLTTGFGRHANEIGPEFGFGHAIGNALEGDVLIIKVAKGGTNLNGNWLSPTAATRHGESVGNMWTHMNNTVDDVLANLDTYFPAYAGRNTEIAGFGWHQGWNDANPTDGPEYEANLADFIVDVRAAYGNDLPIVIGTTSMYPDTQSTTRVEAGQLAAHDPSDNVITVNTRDSYRLNSVSPSSAQHHWNHNGISYFEVGTGMGEAMATLVPEPSSMMLLGAGGLMLARRSR